MKYLVYGVLVLAAIGLLGTLAQETPTIGKEKFLIPELFSFEKFKDVYSKEYESPVEERVRKRIYLARAFKVLLSFIEYKNYKKSFYLKINEMSDWTEEEFRLMMNSMTSLRESGKQPPNKTRKSNVAVETPVASFDEITRKLGEIVDKPEYSYVRRELTLSRIKRDTESQELSSITNSLTLDDLLGNPEANSEILERIPGSNPDYKPPELISLGAKSVKGPYINDKEDFSLMTQISGDEYLNKFMTQHIENMQDKANFAPKINQPGKNGLVIDHRKSNCLTGPKNQGKCNAAYIFAINTLYEFQYCQETGTKTSFSEQYALDCGDRVGLKDCLGGDPVKGDNFFNLYGFELTSAYPYMRTSYVCPYDEESEFFEMGYLKLTGTESYLKVVKQQDLERMLEYKPIVMNFAVSDYFNIYGGGIDDGSRCDPNKTQIMVIVGMGTQNGLDYWVLRNSFGTSWGEDGYYRLDKRASKKCFFEEYGYTIYEKQDENVFLPSKNSKISREVMNRRKQIYSGQYIEPHPNSLK